MPLAADLRPKRLQEYIGQTHLVGEGMPIAQSIATQHTFSMIFWGPPGVGKTSLARLFSKEQGRDFFELSAVSASKADVVKIIETTQRQKTLTETYTPPIVFLDEIHRFTKAQQDFLLPFVENGTIILIGATTENPSFEVIPALLSRMKVYVLQALTDEEQKKIIKRALVALQHEEIDSSTEEWLLNYAQGDGRTLINALEQTHQLYKKITLETVRQTIQSLQLSYDKKGEQHYDTISAFIKSMRAGDVDAALYYLARMVASGEDPSFIARRMVIFASEDVGLANPTALVVANEVFAAVERIGYPEAQINLAHGVAHLSLCKKDRRAYDAYFAALNDVKKYGSLPIPMSLRNAPTKLHAAIGAGKGYEMYPDSTTSLLPAKLKHKKYLKK